MRCILIAFIFLMLVLPVCVSIYSTCVPQAKFNFNSLYKSGDIMIGGVLISHLKATDYNEFTLHLKKSTLFLTFTNFIWKLKISQVLIFAIEEINRSQRLLPNITLGYRLFDNCMNVQVALRAASMLIAGSDEIITTEDCRGLPPVVAIIGDPLSIHSVAISRTLSVYRFPLISYCASCVCLSDKREFPSFLRTVPSDAFQVKAIVAIIKHFKWTWIGLVVTDDDYGLYALISINEQVKKFGCVAFSESLQANDKAKMISIINIIKKTTAKVIVLFLTKLVVTVLIKEIVQQNITGKQWIATDSWSAFPILGSNENFNSFGGTIGILPKRGEIPGLEDFLLQAHPTPDPNNNLLTLFWERIFECTFQKNYSMTSSTSLGSSSKICSGLEDIKSTRTEYSDVSELRASYNVYKAVYALAHALHDLASCENGKGPFENRTCANIKHFQSWQLLHYLKQVNFINNLGERVAFDENGDALPTYDIINWQPAGDGTVISKTIGVYDYLATDGQQLLLKEDAIFWNFNPTTIPESVCSKSCMPGTRKATRKGQPVCCFDCVPCADGEISNAIECRQCSPDHWSNNGRNQCVLREIEYLSYEDAMGCTLTTTALFGTCLSITVLAVFVLYRNTPVVKANNSELSFLLLIALTLCFLCALCFIGQPSDLTCRLRHVVFGISFVLCISCILVKTIVVIMAFKATLPGNNMMKWFGVTQQRGTVFFFTFIQALICIIWLATNPPFPAKNNKYQTAKIIYECDVGSVTGFGCLLGYIGLLAGISFVLAFLARNLPDTFNEAKFITFSMLIFCAVWITFIPAYISSPGKYTVAVEIFAILASSFGLLFAIFAPKCYIILLRPEQNTKKSK
uniref:G-protein coupled receptors family 3 profile domain-containing protein n=1 Tax=Erpetoichthys calabaricus TaxID=27687 RepID=A0A8C4SE32_ERPCA